MAVIGRRQQQAFDLRRRTVACIETDDLIDRHAVPAAAQARRFQGAEHRLVARNRAERLTGQLASKPFRENVPDGKKLDRNTLAGATKPSRTL